MPGLATLLALALALTLRPRCDHSTDRALCESPACRGFAWCAICERCLPEAFALKDEL